VRVLGADAKGANRIVDVKSVEGLYIADNRELAVRDFMRRTDATDSPPMAEWFWTLDTDVTFAPDTLELLLASADALERPIMSALYFGYMNHSNNLVPVWYGREEDGRIVNLKGFKSGPQRLGVVGMGCCLIHRSVFEKFGDKYADTGWLYFGHDVAPWTPRSAIDNDIMPFGEDNCFCHRANELGIPVYGNGSIVVEHRKKRYESMQTFLASFKESNVESNEKSVIARLRREPSKAALGEQREGVGESHNLGPVSPMPTGHSLGLRTVPVAPRNGSL